MHEANLIYQNFGQDLCFLEVAGQSFMAVEFRPSADVEIGEDVFAIGNPHGLDNTMSRGIISNKHQYLGGALLQTDATISFGSSGGGLFDNQGKLIGITRAGHQYKNIAFAVPSEWISNIITAVAVEKHKQGLNISLTDQLKKSLGKLVIRIENIGMYGVDKIRLDRYKGHCFIAFSGQQDDTPRGMLLWYPENALFLYFVPNETRVDNAIRMMIKNHYVSQEKGHLFTKDEHDKALLPSLLEASEVIIKRFDTSPAKQFSVSEKIYLHYPDYHENYKEIEVRFGMMGFNKAYDALKANCQ